MIGDGRIGCRTFALALVVATCGASASGCKRSRVESFAWMIADGGPITGVNDFPFCAPLDEGAPRRRCLDNVTRGFGGDSFVTDPPSHASAAAASILVLRDHAAYALPEPNVWRTVLSSKEGLGADTFRLAVGRALREASKDAAAPARDEATMLRALGAIAGVVPGACPTYRLLAEGKPAMTLRPELRPEHSPCVQADLTAPGGPGATFGDGIPRALAGATMAWKRTVELLRAGEPKTRDRNLRARIHDDLKRLDDVTFTPILPASPVAPALEFVHGHLDAGVIARDAGR
ncbi:MAG: hypothetical protein U0235_29285 [Polyangiaceae bacterium]